jgi:hypothetical protein
MCANSAVAPPLDIWKALASKREREREEETERRRRKRTPPNISSELALGCQNDTYAFTLYKRALVTREMRTPT